MKQISFKVFWVSMVTILLLTCNSIWVFGQFTTATGGFDYNDCNAWGTCPGAVEGVDFPGAGDNAIVNHSVTVPAGTFNCNNLTIDANGAGAIVTLTTNGDLNVAGTCDLTATNADSDRSRLLVNSGSTVTVTGLLTMTSNGTGRQVIVDVNGGALNFDATSGTNIMNVTGTSNIGLLKVRSGGSMTFDTNVKINSEHTNTNSSKFQVQASCTINGNLDITNDDSFSTGDGESMLEINGTGALDLNGNLVISENVGASAGDAKVDFIASGGTLNLQGSFSNSGGTLSSVTGASFIYDGTAAQAVIANVANTVYPKLVINKASGVAILNASLEDAEVLDGISVLLGEFDNNGNAIVGGVGETFRVAPGATMDYSGNSTPYDGSFGTEDFSGIVKYSGSTAATIEGDVSYSRLEIETGTHVLEAGKSITCDSLTITSGTLQMSTSNIDDNGDGNGTLTIASGASIEMNSTGNYPNDGSNNFANYSLDRNSTVIYSDASAHTIHAPGDANGFGNLTIGGTAAYTLAANSTVRRLISYTAAGTLDISTFTLTLASSASGDAGIGDVSTNSGTLTTGSGSVVQQRFITQQGGSDWYMMSSFLTDAIYNDISDGGAAEFILSCAANCDVGATFQNIYNYVEGTAANNNGDINDGWTAVADGDGSMGHGTATSGFIVYENGAGMSFPATISMNGASVDVDNVLITPSFTGGADDDGWNLIGNPLTCAVTMGSGAAAGVIDNAATTITIANGPFRLRNDGSYQAAGDATWEALATGEAFFVELSGAGNMSFEESDKDATATGLDTDNYNARKRNSNLSYPVVYLNTTNSEYTCETILALNNYDPAVTVNKDPGKDHTRVPNFKGYSNTSFLVDDSVDVSYNQIPIDAPDLIIPIRVYKATPSGSSDTYTFKMDNVESVWTTGRCVSLEDRVTGIFTSFTDSTSSYSATFSDTTSTPRFYLHLSQGVELDATTDVSCFGVNDGSAEVSGIGAGPFDYTWKNSGGAVVASNSAVTGSDMASGLPAGSYTVEVSNTTCGAITQAFEIVEPLELTSSTSVSDPVCNGNSDGSLSALGSNYAPFSYIWKDAAGNVIRNVSGVASTDVLAGVGAGIYSVDITDSLGCSVSSTGLELIDPAVNSASTSEVNPTCLGDSDGKLIATGVSSGPYNYVWKDMNGAVVRSSSNISGADTLNQISSGLYTVDITDANGCSYSTAIAQLNDPTATSVTSTLLQSVTCSNGSDASIAATGNQNGPFDYEWFDNAGNSIQLNSAVAADDTISSLTAGIYMVQVTDANGCVSNLETVTISDGQIVSVTSVITNITCNGLSDGSIEAEGDINGPFTYDWMDDQGIIITSNTSASSDVISSLTPGDYSVVVTNNVGCVSDEQFFTLTEPVVQSADVISEDASCFGMNDGSAEVMGTGSGPFAVTWMDNTGQVISSNSVSSIDILDNLSPGQYSVLIVDNSGCSSSQTSFSIAQPQQIVPAFSANETVVDLATGATVQFTNASQGATGYSWGFGDGQTSTDVDPSHTYGSVGLYDVILSAINGNCSESTSVNIQVINTTGIVDESGNAVSVFNDKTQWFALIEFASLKNVDLVVFNPLGQEIFRGENSIKSGKINVPIEDVQGVWLVDLIYDNQHHVFKVFK